MPTSAFTAILPGNENSKMFNKTTKRWIKAYKGGTNLINLAFTRAVKRGDQFTNLPKNIAIDIKKKKVVKIFSDKGKFNKLFKDAVKTGNSLLKSTNIQYNKTANPNVFIDTKANIPLKNPYVQTGSRKGQIKKKYVKQLAGKDVNLKTKVIENTSQTQAKLNDISENKLE